MPFKRYEPFEKQETCTHPEHDPPGMIVLEPGTHVYECPRCGAEQSVIVPPRPMLGGSPDQVQVNHDISNKGLASWYEAADHCVKGGAAPVEEKHQTTDEWAKQE